MAQGKGCPVSQTRCEHNWDDNAICKKCRISYHTHIYYKLKEKEIDLRKAYERIAQLEALLEGKQWKQPTT